MNKCGKAMCRGYWELDPCNWTSYCETGWEYDPDDFNISSSDCSQAPKYINIDWTYTWGGNSIVEFCGMENGQSKHGKATCRGDWDVDPCNWKSYCETGWEYNPDDFWDNCYNECQ